MSLPDKINLPLVDDESPGIELIRIPAGNFLMGARGRNLGVEPVHRVCIPNDFYLGKYPVTQRQFSVWTGLAGIDHSNDFPGKDNHPAENMSWQEAVQYCQWVTERYQLYQKKYPDWPGEYECALPTEARWEYACSAWLETPTPDGAGQRVYTEYHTGDGEAALQQAGWYGGNSDSQTQAVGSKEANRHGLYDMHGNVWEWCMDDWDDFAYRKRPGIAKDPLVHGAENAYRVIRGGSWDNLATLCRAACRDWNRPGDRYWNQGFRVGLFPVHSCQPEQTEQPAE